jgi:hypothetical protein
MAPSLPSDHVVTFDAAPDVAELYIPHSEFWPVTFSIRISVAPNATAIGGMTEMVQA